MKTREAILAKAAEYKAQSEKDPESVEGELYWALTWIAGEDEADMCNVDGTFDFLWNMERVEEGNQAEASRIALAFFRS